MNETVGVGEITTTSSKYIVCGLESTDIILLYKRAFILSVPPCECVVCAYSISSYFYEGITFVLIQKTSFSL